MVASGQRIELTFDSFDLENARRCKYDYVQIYDEKYCGSNKPDPIISTGNTLNITFHSDYSVIRNGFKATWKAVGDSGIYQADTYILLILLSSQKIVYSLVVWVRCLYILNNRNDKSIIIRQ